MQLAMIVIQRVDFNHRSRSMHYRFMRHKKFGRNVVVQLVDDKLMSLSSFRCRCCLSLFKFAILHSAVVVLECALVMFCI